jgi:hypothetical protein
MTNWRDRQNGDGGWAYVVSDASRRDGRGCSWTEPTVYALLAQAAASEGAAYDNKDAAIAGVRAKDRESYLRGAKFLSSIARRDGGCSPQTGVEESTWVTALVALLPEDAVSERQRRQAIDWLRDQTGAESGWLYKLQQRLNGNKADSPEGWAWFPGAAAWVIPTSFGILAFERAIRHQDGPKGELQERVEAGRKFLLGHMCADGGWNHGASKALGRDGDSYPETTGIALLALNGVTGDKAVAAQMERAKAAARKHLAVCRTAEGIAWLRMGLAAHGEDVAAAFQPVCRTNMDLALMSLAGASRNPLVG